MHTICPTYHVPVLLHPTVDGLNMRPDGVYIDATFGGGGHSREILARLGENGRLFSFDQDADAVANVPEHEERLTFVASNFRFLSRWMRFYDQVGKVDGVLADLGVSSHHFDAEERGFSFRFDAPLDMRMNVRGGNTAAQVLNTATEEQLAKVFQALHIEVNHEMDALEEMLQAALRVLRPGGRLSVLTYHSLEDRMVKNFMRSGNIAGKVEQDFYGNRLSPLLPVNNKVIIPSEEEQLANPRSRSAKLRIAEKL